MDLPSTKQWEYFIAVAEELHFGRAASRSGIAQPPLTQQIQKLESLLGCRLFERHKSVKLTAAGQELLRHAYRIIELSERAVLATGRAARGETGQLSIGVPPTVLLSNLPTVISKFRARYRELDFRLTEGATSAIEDKVRSGELHLGFLRETVPQEPLHSRVYLEEPVVALLPAKHPLTKRTSLQLRDLRDEDFVFFPRIVGPALHDKLTSACATAGFHPRIVQEATQWQSVVAFVEAGAGVALAPDCVRSFHRKGVAVFPIPKLTTTVHVCWLGELEPAARNFLKLALTRVQANA